MKDRKQIRNIAFSLLAVVIVTAVLLIDSHKTLYHFQEVDPGRLYRCGTLSERGLRRTHRLTGFKTIVNLRAEREYDEDGGWYEREKTFALKNNVRLVNIPMEPDTPPSPEQIARFLSLFDSPEHCPVIVHCAQGVIRTGMMVAVYEIALQGKDNAKVLEGLDWFGHKLDKRPQVRDFILAFAADRKALAA